MVALSVTAPEDYALCPRCGETLLPRDEYCSKCGRPVAYDRHIK